MKISVVIPLYNKKETILRALNSVLSQTVLPEEIIVVNDGSKDGSEQIVLQLDHPLINLISQPNAGVSAARNKGINESKTEWIAFLDADDEWLPDYLKTIHNLHQSYRDAKVIATSYYLQDEASHRRVVILKRLNFKNSGILNNYFEVAASSEPPLNSSSVVIQRKAILEIDGFPIGIKSGEDLLTWARLAVKNKIAYSTNPQSVFMQDAANSYLSMPSRAPQEPDIVGRKLAMLVKENSFIPYLSRYVSHWHKMRASIYLRLGKKKKSVTEVRKSFSYNKLNFKLLLYVVLILIPTTWTNQIFKRFRNA